jgi:hypothetical protein
MEKDDYFADIQIPRWLASKVATLQKQLGNHG